MVGMDKGQNLLSLTEKMSMAYGDEPKEVDMVKALKYACPFALL